MKKLLFILIALLQLKVAMAQTFPVRVTPQAIPPYPTNLSGYANSGITNSPLRVQLVLSDVTASSREVRLAVAIEGNGINAISAPVVIGAPTLIVDGGIPLNLTISELAPYFEQQNLQGISSVQYNSPLPDGSYRFCFEVFDAFTGNRLSSKNCATIFLINNDPPFLNKPDNQAKISEQNPTNIIFQWTPRHINVPNVSYEFSIVEVWDPYIDPQAIFVASPPLYQEVTTNTSLLYGPVQPLLLAGKRYAWRVRAFATNNGEEVSVFNNNGNSEIFWFDYQASCELPSNIQVQDVSMTNATISWIGHPDHLDYTIKYREAGGDRWYSKTTPRDYVTIDEFKADTVYEYRVVGNCTQNSFGESPVDTFRTLSEELADYASCGIQPDPVDLSNQELLTELFVNDVFTAGDFPVYVKEVSGSTSFTGEGYISTPWLATVRIPVKFENIKINTEMKLVDGFVVTTYDPNWGSIVDGDVIIDTILGDDGDVQVIDVDVDITNIEIDENGDIIIITSDGPLPDTFDGGNDIIFVDNTGEEWHVDADGDVSKGEQAEGGPANSGNTDGVSSGGVNEITAAGITVTFNNTNGFYSFDTVPENAGGSIANEYDKVPISGGGEYNIPYKAIAALPDHPTDFVTAEVAISTNDHSASDIIFKTKEGTKVQATWDRDSTTATLSLKKAFDFAKQQIIATVRPKDSTDKYKVAGAANLWHLANQDVATINVKLISVNGASLSGIGERINKIYNPAGVQFNVTSTSPLTVSDTTLDVGDSSLLSQYTEGEKAWISQFKTLPGYQRDTYYLFVTDIPPSDSGTEGFMPLKRQFGFVFAGDDKGRTAAHELGHGVFGLEHPFKKYNTTGTTDLLMDYGTGVRLSHMDWEKMHAPGIQIYWFQGDEDGELAGEVWFTPKWEPIKIKGSSRIVSTSQSSQVKGTLPGFRVDGIRYTALFSSSGNFSGYYEGGKSDGNKYEITSINEKDIDKVYLFVKGDDNCNIAYETTYEYAIANKTSIIYDSTNTNIKDSGRIKCASCPDGKKFIEDYINKVSDIIEKESIESIAALICAEGEGNIDYDILVAQINKDFSDQLNNVFWGSDRALFERARDSFWDQGGTFTVYLEALLKVNQNINAYNEKLGSNVSKEEFYSALYYLNDNFIKTLNYEEKEKLLELIFEHNIFISENFFVDGTSDVSLIKKVIRSIEDDNLNILLDKIVNGNKTYAPDEQSGLSQKRDVLFEIVHALEFNRLKDLDIKIKTEALSRMLNGNIFSLFGTKYHYQDVITKLLKSVKNEEAASFLTSLEDPTKSFDEKPLVFHLKTRLTDFFTDSDAYSSFFKEINRLCAERSLESPNTYGIKAEISWKVENRDYVLLSFVRDKNDYKYVYDESTHKVQLLTCKNTVHTRRGTRCVDEINLLEESGSPFDMVMVYFYENASPYSPVADTRLYDEPALEATGHIIPVMFLEYMYKETGEQIAKNFGWNTFNVVITVATLGEGAAAISAVRVAASSGTKILFRTILRQSYSLIDLSLTVGGTAYQFGTGDKLPKAFEYVGYFLAAKTTYDLLNGGLKGLATIDNASAVQKQKYLDDLEILNNEGQKITLKEFDELITKSKNLVRDNERLNSEYRRILLELKLGVSASKNSILAKLDGITDPKILTFKDWINKLDDIDATLLDRIDKLGDDVVKFGKDFDFSKSSIISKFSNQPDLVKSWEVLKEFPNIRVANGNIDVLLKVSKRFKYNNKTSFEGLTDLFNGSAASKQKLINGLNKADELFDSSLPVTFSGVKRGEVIANIESTEDLAKVIDKNGDGDEVARFIDGILEKRKVIPDGDGVTIAKKGTKPEDDILRIGNEIGFRDINNIGSRFIAKSASELRKHLNDLTDIPNGKTYTGDLYRSLSKNAETNFNAKPDKMTDHSVYSSWGRYDLDGQENAMYLSKTLSGNKTELVPHYGDWTDYSTYNFSNIKADNLLDLTDDIVRKQLGTEFDQLTKVIDIPENIPYDQLSQIKKEMYEFTNEIASWARKKGYNGIIANGARGSKDYDNVIIFDQNYIDEILSGITPTKISK